MPETLPRGDGMSHDRIIYSHAPDPSTGSKYEMHNRGIRWRIVGDGHHDVEATGEGSCQANEEGKRNVFRESEQVIYFFLIALRRIVSSPMKTPF